ncbi:4689_t:CDS:2 [Gigaspora rosea]|nr:4689_t:CDS:2 [Gigaspora rosea]
MHFHLLPFVIECLSKDKSSLHSCIQVNRLWCRTAIPVLWSDPFRYVTEDKENFPEIIFIYLGSLEKSAKQKFLSKIPDDKKSLFKTPTFDYVKFLKHFNYWMVVGTIKEAARTLNFQLFYFNDDNPLEGTIKTHILNLIYVRSLRLDQLTIADHYGLGHFLGEKDYKPFKRVRNGNFLKQIKKLSFCINYPSLYKIFSWMPDHCPNVKHLKFRLKTFHDSDSSTITNVLSKFNDIRTFKLRIHYRGYKDEEILPSIANNIHSLTTIVFCNCNLKNNKNLIQEITQCKGLIELKFLLCTGLTIDKANLLINANFPMLKSVELWGDDYCDEIVNWGKSISPQFYDDPEDA